MQGSILDARGFTMMSEIWFMSSRRGKTRIRMTYNSRQNLRNGTAQL